MKQSIANDATVKYDTRTILVYQQAGNNIPPSIQLKVDIPSNHEDEKILSRLYSIIKLNEGIIFSLLEQLYRGQ